MQVLSDQTWKGREGSIKHDSVYNGEICDSRSDRPDWAQPGFNDSYSAWITPESLPSPVNSSLNGTLVLQDMPPIRAGAEALHFEVTMNDEQYGYLTAEDIGKIQGGFLAGGAVLKPVATWRSDSGMFSILLKKIYNECFTDVHTFDLGQNMAGWCRLNFKGPSGFGTYIRYAEVLVQPVVSTK